MVAKVAAPAMAAKLAAPEGPGPDAVAVIAVAGRFPGARSPEALFEELLRGACAVTEVPASRWDAARFHDPDPEAPNRTVSRWGGFLEDIEGFDPLFHRISPREARSMDPQQRLLLEVGWELLERAGLAGIGRARGGVFIGAMWSGYLPFVGDADLDALGVEADSFFASGNALSVLSNRLSYAFDLIGPSLTVDTACSSSLVAVHLGAEALLRGACDFAIAGGVSVNPSPVKYVTTSKAGMFSPTGRCWAFDAAADGMVPGEGVGLALLKRLDRALADGDQVLAVIRGSAVTSDGRTNGLTAPSPAAQRDCVRAALEAAGVPASALSYVEAHGTGTPLGDPIELAGLAEAFREATRRRGFCGIGSIKPAIGHLEGAAGAASLLKVILALGRRELPPSLHFERPNPHIGLAGSPFYVVDRRRPWEGPAPLRAGVNSFGFGGTNAHVVVEEAPPAPPRAAPARDPAAPRGVGPERGGARRADRGARGGARGGARARAGRVLLGGGGAEPFRAPRRGGGGDAGGARGVAPRGAGAARAGDAGARAPAGLSPPGPGEMDAADGRAGGVDRGRGGGALPVRGRPGLARVLSAGRARRVALPTYPFQRQPLWFGAERVAVAALARGAGARREEAAEPRSLLGRAVRAAARYRSVRACSSGAGIARGGGTRCGARRWSAPRPCLEATSSRGGAARTQPRR